MKMNYFVCSVCALLTIAFCQAAFPANISAQQNSAVAKKTTETLNNDSIAQMYGSGVAESVIIARIKTSDVSFDTSGAALQSLKKQGVSDSIILAMVQKASGMEVSSGGSAAVPTAPVSGSFTIPDGTELKIVSIEEISGQKVKEGDPLTFKIADDLKINGATVIAKGAVVKGTVSNAKKKGLMGRSGELSIRIESTQAVDGQKVKLRATKSGEGGNNTGSTVALTVLFGPIGLLRHGKEAVIKTGTILSAYTDETVNVNLSK